ncbi:39151_t:CDS:2, partial [Gigaspora margarita]
IKDELLVARMLNRIEVIFTPVESIDVSTIRRKAKGIEIKFRELRNDEKFHLSKAREFLNVKESGIIKEVSHYPLKE